MGRHVTIIPHKTVRDLLKEYPYRVSAKACAKIVAIVEEEMTEVAHHAGRVAHHSGRTTIEGKDVTIALEEGKSL